MSGKFLSTIEEKKKCKCTQIRRIFTETKAFKCLVLISKGKYHWSLKIKLKKNTDQQISISLFFQLLILPPPDSSQ